MYVLFPGFDYRVCTLHCMWTFSIPAARLLSALSLSMSILSVAIFDPVFLEACAACQHVSIRGLRLENRFTLFLIARA